MSILAAFYVPAFFSGYLIGSFPTAYLLVRRTAGIDIRQAGSGNVGGFNAFDVTRSKKMGLVVTLIDALKGTLVAAVAGFVIGGPFWLQGTALLGAVVGHNYSVWLGFKGGRGLATLAGGVFAIGVSLSVVWCLCWVVFYKLTHDILKANVTAILAAPFVMFLLPAWAIRSTMVRDVPVDQYLLFSLIACTVIFISHVKPAKEIFVQMLYHRRK